MAEGDTPASDDGARYSQQATLSNIRGLHARAAAKICAVANMHDADITIRFQGITVTACSIMGMLLLGAHCGETVEISATGRQAREGVDALAKLIADRFGEEK